MNAASSVTIPQGSEAPLIFFSIFLSVIRSGNFRHSLVLFCNMFILPFFVVVVHSAFEPN